MMISLEKVEEGAKEREDSNYTFRIFLKSHVDSEELDELIHSYHKKVFKNLIVKNVEIVVSEYFTATAPSC